MALAPQDLNPSPLKFNPCAVYPNSDGCEQSRIENNKIVNEDPLKEYSELAHSAATYNANTPGGRKASRRSRSSSRKRKAVPKSKWVITREKVVCKDGVKRTVWKNSAGQKRVRRMVTRNGKKKAAYFKY